MLYGSVGLHNGTSNNVFLLTSRLHNIMKELDAEMFSEPSSVYSLATGGCCTAGSFVNLCYAFPRDTDGC